MALSKQPYKGTRDFFPADMRLRNYIFQKLCKVSEQFAYEPYDGPVLEELELYKAKSGEELINEQVYNFTDRGGREVAIRPEMTPTVARLAAQKHREIPKPIRWYAIPNLMRYEKMQKGRLREFWQYNADVFGAGTYGEVEILQLCVQLMKSFGATSEHFEVLINDRNLVDFVFGDLLKLTPDIQKKLYKLVDNKKKMDSVKFTTEATNLLIDAEKVVIFQKYSELDSFESVNAFIASFNSDGSKSLPLVKVMEQLQHLGLTEYVKFDPSIVRGLDYYTGVVFEIFDKHPDNRRAIAGGGSYANLLKIFDEPALEGVGIGLGEVPLTIFLETHKLIDRVSFAKADMDYLLAYLTRDAESTAMQVAGKLRDAGKKVEVYFGEAAPKKIFTYSEKKNFKYVAFIGEEELRNGDIKIKELATKAEHLYKINNLLEKLGLSDGN
jgi:histidyl-tRNA synthetase